MIQSKDLGNPCISVKTLNFVYLPHDRVLNWQNYIDFKQWFFSFTRKQSQFVQFIKLPFDTSKAWLLLIEADIPIWKTLVFSHVNSRSTAHLKKTKSFNLIKVRQSRNVFFKLTILPKKERKNSVFLPNSTMIELFCSFFGRIRG